MVNHIVSFPLTCEIVFFPWLLELIFKSDSSLLRYDVIAKMETFSEDTQFILSQAGLQGKLTVEWKHRTGENISGDDDYDKLGQSCAKLRAGLNFSGLDYILIYFDWLTWI